MLGEALSEAKVQHREKLFNNSVVFEHAQNTWETVQFKLKDWGNLHLATAVRSRDCFPM